MVQALDLTPALIQHGRRHAALAGLEIEFTEGDVEDMPYADPTFDVVTSPFGHMLAPRPDVAIAEMLRVLKPGGTLAFSTLSPQHYRKALEETLGPVAKLVATLKGEPAKLSGFRAGLDSFVARHFENNVVRQHYLMTRARKQ